MSRLSSCFIARRAYCVGTPLIFLFVRRPSGWSLFWTGILQNMPGTQSAFKTGSVRDILQNHTLWKTIRMSHGSISKGGYQEDNSGPFGTFCKTSPYGRQSECATCPFPSPSGVIQMISRIVVASAGKFERFLHNRSFGPPLPCGCILVIATSVFFGNIRPTSWRGSLDGRLRWVRRGSHWSHSDGPSTRV